jgi:protein-L-isoaspartate(D-aspartate) O-methyltransferase
VAIDAERQLFNGGPTAVAPLIDALDLVAGVRVLHVGCGLGYYSALIAHVVGPPGRVLAIDVDVTLAAKAKGNLASFGWVEVRHGDGSEALREPFDAILVHAGVTHPLDAWLDGLTVGGRLVVPLTASLPQMGSLGKGLAFVITHHGDEVFDARPLDLLVIYTAVGVRDESLNPLVGGALMNPTFTAVKRLRRDSHEQGPACWLHGPTFCLGM